MCSRYLFSVSSLFVQALEDLSSANKFPTVESFFVYVRDQAMRRHCVIWSKAFRGCLCSISFNYGTVDSKYID